MYVSIISSEGLNPGLKALANRFVNVEIRIGPVYVKPFERVGTLPSVVYLTMASCTSIPKYTFLFFTGFLPGGSSSIMEETSVYDERKKIVDQYLSELGAKVLKEERTLPYSLRYEISYDKKDLLDFSQKIESREEKDRLKRLLKSITPKGFGVIVRTVAEGKKVAELDKDLQNLLTRWTAKEIRLSFA